MSKELFAEGSNTILGRAKARVTTIEKLLSDAQWALIEENIKVEKMCKEWGHEPITLQANTVWPTHRLYVLTQEGRNFISQYNYESPGVAYDMLFSVVQQPNNFIVIELTKEYLDYLQTLDILEQVSEEDLLINE